MASAARAPKGSVTSGNVPLLADPKAGMIKLVKD